MQVESDAVIQSDAFIIDRIAADEAEAERNDLVALSPDEKARSFRHPLCDCAKIIRSQGLEF